jgi:hypothetical protein
MYKPRSKKVKEEFDATAENNQVLSGGVQSHDFANCLIQNPFLLFTNACGNSTIS